MSRRLRPQNLSNISSSIPDDLDYEKLGSSSRDNAVLAGCGVTPRISLDEVADRPGTSRGKPGHRRAVSSFSFARKLQIDTEQPAHNDPTPMDDIDITSPDETHILVSLEKGTNHNLPPTPIEPPITARPLRRRTRPENEMKVDREIWKMLLLNMYPVTYLILWMPGIANRIAEGMGHDVRWLVIAQSSTQFIGLANAAVYVYKEHRRDLREWMAGVRSRKAAKHTGGDASVPYWRSVSS